MPCLLLVAPTDLRPPRGLPARSPSAPRASLGASARSPARPRRPRGGLQSVGVSVCCTARPRHRPPALQPAPPVPPAPFPPVGPGVLTCGSARRLEARPGPATAHGHRSRAFRRLRCSPHAKRWGFCTTRSLLAACRRRVEPSCSAIPPIGAAAGRGYRVWVSCLEACSILSFACNSLMPAVCSSAKSPEFQRLHFKA